MSTITFDTQELVRELRTAGLPQEQAEAVVRTIVKSHAELVTRDYLDARIEAAKADLVKWFAGLLIAQAALIAALVKLL